MFSYTLENYCPIHIPLFINVKNSVELRKRLLSHDSELSFDAKVVKILLISVLFWYMAPSYIKLIFVFKVLDKFQLLIATNNAVHCESLGLLKIHNVHLEIVYNLFPKCNIQYLS